jgi:hypothetical protein
MGVAREKLVRQGEPGFYHCVSRIVRRAYLLGEDPFSKGPSRNGGFLLRLARFLGFRRTVEEAFGREQGKNGRLLENLTLTDVFQAAAGYAIWA